MNPNVTFAIFKRNFVSYFSNPTGYVFICGFVLVSAFAAFWPNEFFSNNLANLDQLNSYFPLIMLVFIPAITMNIWADERRQGTDETLLTLPASDLDVVAGKYLAAVAIFTVSLAFSSSNALVLSLLGSPDWGVIAANYFGYWMVGLAMLGVGMMGSFLTRNLTVSFILGVALNAPLVFLASADTIAPANEVARALAQASISAQFADFGRGLITLSSTTYFLGIVGVSLYICMVLIGQRHWAGSTRAEKSNIVLDQTPNAVLLVMLAGGLVALVASFVMSATDGELSQQATVVAYLVTLLGWIVAAGVTTWFMSRTGGHFLLRMLSLAAIVGCLATLALQYDRRFDVSEEQLSTLSNRTREILAALKPVRGQVGKEGTPTETSFVGAEGLLEMDEAYTGATIKFTGGPLQGRSSQVASYDGETRRFTLDRPLPRVPQPGNPFVLERPRVTVNAFLSPEVPEEYVQTRLNLLSLLEEMESLGGSQIEVRIHSTEPLSKEAATAEEQYSIRPQLVASASRGSFEQKTIYMGANISCGLEKVTIPFFYDRGMPAEYELARSIATVSQQKRKKVGIVMTDVPLYGEFNFAARQMDPDSRLIRELEKQYDLERVDLSQDLQPGQYDVLLALQPTSLAPDQFKRLEAAIRAGVPTMVCEDPHPMNPRVPATSEPRRPPQTPFGMGGNQQPPPKDMFGWVSLFEMLGVSYDDETIVFHQYNPVAKLGMIPPEIVFIGDGSGAEEPFNEDLAITREMQSLCFPWPGKLEPKDEEQQGPLKFTPLVQTGPNCGWVVRDEMMDSMQSRMGRRAPRSFSRGVEYVMAAKITGQLPAPAGGNSPETTLQDARKQKRPAKGAGPDINVVLVADIDFLGDGFINIQEQGGIPISPTERVDFALDNLTFLLNVLDDLADDEQFVELRNRQRKYRILETLQVRTENARNEAEEQRQEFESKMRESIEEVRDRLQKEVDEIVADKSMNNIQKQQILQQREQEHQRRLDAERTRLERQQQDELRRIERELELEIREIQSLYKMLAVALPPIPPLLIGLFVFIVGRVREREGIPERRLR